MRSERAPIPRSRLLLDLVRLGSHSGGQWPRASLGQWEAALDAAIADGALIESNGKVRLPPIEQPRQESQMELF